MGKQKYKLSSKNRRNDKLSTYLILPIALILLIVPLIVHMKIVPISPSAVPFWKGGSSDYDFFSYYKMVWFLILTGAAIVAFVIKLFNNNFQIKKTYFYIPMGIYTLFVILSTLTSKTKDVAMSGFPNRYEGMIVLIAYMAVLFLVINLLDNEKQLTILLGCLFVSALIIGLIGTFQYFNMDLFQTTFGKKLMLPAAQWSLANTLTFQLGPRAVYGTLYHTNYVGSFTAMLFPLTLAFFIFAEKRSYKVSAGVLNVIMFFCLFTSHSRAGIFGAAVAAVLILIIAYAGKKLMPNIGYIGGLAVVLILATLLANGVSNNSVGNKIGTLYNDSSPSPTSVAGIKDVQVTKDKLSFIDKNGALNIALTNGQMKVTDENNKKVPFEFDTKTNSATFKQPKYAGYKLTILNYQKQAVIQVERNTLKVDFIVTPAGYKLLGAGGEVLDINPVKRWGFKGYENLGSARGYIWSRSLPLLKDTVITGFGPDTFAIHFPQNDYIGKLLAYGTTSIIVDKPHNLYLQTGLNTGMISLLALLALFIMYIVFCFKVYFNREFNTLLEISGAGIFAAICGYLIAGLFNDSTLSVSPVFWVLLGTGISINMMLNGKKSID